MSATNPSPEPQPDITVLVPASSPFPTPIVNLPEVDPWAWSLDTVIGIVAALASAAVAIVAIVVTSNRAKADHDRQVTQIAEERQLRERAQRKVVGDAALAYIESIDEQGEGPGALDRLERAFADADIPEEPLYRWLVESGQTRFWACFSAAEDANPDPESDEPPKPSYFIYKMIDADVRGRIRGWIRTGEIDASPVPTLQEMLKVRDSEA